MQVTLAIPWYAFRPSCEFRFADQRIPLRRTSWYCCAWQSPNGRSYAVDIRKQTITSGEEIVAHCHPAGRGRGSWGGILPLTYAWRGCVVRFHEPGGRLLMYYHTGGLLRHAQAVIRPSAFAEFGPILCGMAFATILD
jgi:hypothetical protein